MIKLRRHYRASIVFLSILAVLALFLAGFFYKSKDIDLSVKKIKSSETTSVNYALHGNDGKVYNGNGLYSFKNDLIKDVDVYYNYSISFSDSVNGEYYYYINNYIVDNNDKVLSIYKTDLQKFDFNGDVININEDLKLEYSKIYNEYIKYTNGGAKDVYVKSEMLVYYSVYNGFIDRNVSDTVYLNLDFKFKNNEVTLSNSKVKTINSSLFSRSSLKSNRIYFVIIMEFVGSGLLFILIIIFIIEKLKAIKKSYEYKIEYYLNNYSKYIVKIDELLDMSEYKMVFVSSFYELMNICLSKKLMINYYEVIEGFESIFFILKGNLAYVYKVKK